MNEFLSKENKITNLLHLVSLLAVGTTFFGFIIVNIYLSIYGFWDFNFLKVQYFSAGGLFMFFVAVPVILFYGFIRAKDILERYRNEDKTFLKSASIFIGKFFIFVFFTAISFIIFMLPLTLGKVINSSSFIYSLCIVWVTLIFLGVLIMVKSHKEIVESRTKKLNFHNIIIYFEAHYRLLYFFFAIPLLILMFSIFVYVSVPRYLGGGKPETVSIGLNSNFNGEEIGVKSPFDATMVYESENSALILVNKETYLIKQSNINYIKYLDTIIKK